MTHILRVDEMASYRKDYGGIYRSFGDHHTEYQYSRYFFCGDFIPVKYLDGIIVPFNCDDKKSCLPVCVKAKNSFLNIEKLEEQLRDIIDNSLTPSNKITLVDFCNIVGESFEYEILFKVVGTLYNKDRMDFTNFLVDTFEEYHREFGEHLSKKMNIDIVKYE